MKINSSVTSGSKRIKTFLLKYKAKYISGFFVLAVISLLQLISPKIMGELIDYLNAGNIISSKTLRYVIILVLISFLLLLLHFVSRLLLMKTANMFAHVERTNMFGKIVELSMDFFTRRSTGEIMALATNDVEAIRHMLGRGITLFFNMIFVMISSIFIIGGTIGMDMALLMLIPMPLLLVIMARFGIVINRRFRKVQQTFQEMTEKAQENITGIRVIKSFVQEDAETGKFSELNRNNYNANLSLIKIQGVFAPLMAFIMDLGQLFVLFYGGRLALEGRITLGDFIALNSYAAIIMRPIRMIGNLITIIQRGRASMQRISEVLKLEPDIYDGKFTEAGGHPAKTSYSVEFCDLSFRYGENTDYVLKNISFGIEKGKTLGIIGRIGSGKSTIVNLLLRLYETEKRGQILINGKDIAGYSLFDLRNTIGYVPQENIIFSDKFSSNIDFVPEKHDNDRIKEAAEKAHIYDRITGTKNGFDTLLGERGINLSGGEKQRLAIARALIKNADIMIFDDCLSAVDTNTEKKITETLKRERHNKAVIIISHRISTIMDSDEIIVLENGGIVERGTHASLMEKNGIYKRSYERQAMEEDLSIYQAGG